MALKIVTGGSTGAADGTLVSSGNPLVITALNTAIDAHIRCDDGYWSNDQSFDVPAELKVSFDGGSTYYGNADEPITAPEIYAVNYPIKIKQTVSAGSTSGSFTTNGTYTAIAALSTPTLTATVISSTQIDLSWTNVANEDASPGYTIERSLDGSSWSALTTKAANVTTHSDTGLTDSTHYYYRVKAEGSGRYSDSSYGTDDDTTLATLVAGFAAAVSGTTVALSWSAYSGADHYQIEWGTDGVTYGNTIDSVSGTSYNHTGRTANTVYYYRIKAHDSGHTAITSTYATCYAGVQVLVLAAASREIGGSSGTWSTVRSGGGTNTAYTADGTEHAANNQLSAGTYQLERMFVAFTTSGGVIPSGATIDEGWLRLTNTGDATTKAGAAICKGSWSSDPPAASDMAAFSFSDLGGPASDPANNTPTDYAITSPNSNIVKNGTARFVIIERSKDLANSAPGDGSWTGHTFGGKGNSTTDYRPQLKVSFHG